MKNGKNPTLKQKKNIRSAGLNLLNWLVTKNLSNELLLIHRATETKRKVPIVS